MSELPYFPFYVNDFASSGKVEAMTTKAVGAYILLLCKAWHEKPAASIPNDDSILARWARLTEVEWAECKPLVLSAFTRRNDNRWHNKRLREEYDKLQRQLAQKSKSGKKGAKNLWHKIKGEKEINDGAITPPCQSPGNQIQIQIQKEDIKTPPAPPGGDRSLSKGAVYHTPEYQARKEIALDVLREVNEKCGKKYGPTDYHEIDVIIACLDEGRNREDFTRIIDTKLRDPHFTGNRNLYRPSTLFRAEKFGIYLDEDPDAWGPPPVNMAKIPELEREEKDRAKIRREVFETFMSNMSKRDTRHDKWFAERKIELAEELSETSFSAFIAPLVVWERTDTVLTLLSPPETAEWVRDHYTETIQGAVGLEVKIIDGGEE